MTKEQIVNKIYARFGTDSRILFGIKDRQIVENIVELTLKLKATELGINQQHSK